MRVMCSIERPMRARYGRRSRAEPACPASTSVISSPSTSRYACAPMSRTTCTFGRTSITLDARCRSREIRVLADERPPKEVRGARDQRSDDHLSKADLIETAADRDAGHERNEHRDARDHAKRHETGCEQTQGGIGNQLHRGRELEDRCERD